MTGNFWRAGCWAWASSNKPQLQKTMPAAAVPVFRKSRRVVIATSSMCTGLVCPRQAMLFCLDFRQSDGRTDWRGAYAIVRGSSKAAFAPACRAGLEFPAA
jgi:hypothetical protein